MPFLSEKIFSNFNWHAWVVWNICKYEKLWVSFHFRGFLIPKMLENWCKQEFSFNLVLLVLFQIDRCIWLLFTLLFKTNRCEFYFIFQLRIYLVLVLIYIINTLLLFIYDSGFSFYQHLCCYIPQENRNLTIQKKTHCASPVTSDTVLHYTVFDGHIPHPGGKFHSKSNTCMREVHQHWIIC